MGESGEAPRGPLSIDGWTLSILRGPSVPPGLPAVTLSWAQASSGAIAAAGGARVALSCPESLTLTHRLRAMHQGILVGIGTVISDDPLLSVRLADGPQPQPVVLDSHLRFPLSARLLARADRKPWIFHSDAPAEKARELERRGARLFQVARAGEGLDIAAVLRVLAAQGIDSLMVEGGAHVLRSFLSRELAQQAVITVCPFDLEGPRVLEPDAWGRTMPAFLESWQENHGRDTVTWGRFRSP
jgi:riboflavin-specific deaminase-like protein